MVGLSNPQEQLNFSLITNNLLSTLATFYFLPFLSACLDFGESRALPYSSMATTNTPLTQTQCIAPRSHHKVFPINSSKSQVSFGSAKLCRRNPLLQSSPDPKSAFYGNKRIAVGRRGVAQAASSDLVVCFGEMLIDFVPTENGVSLCEAPAFKKAPGGAPANVAVGISRLGGCSAFVGKVGQDEFGVMLADMLKDNKVESSGVRFDPGARTALAFVTLKKNGEREFMFYRNPSADMLLTASELDSTLLKSAKIFHYGSISLIAEPCKSAHLAAMKIAREGGALLSYDPNLRLPLWPSAEDARAGIMSIWNEADIIKISDEEVGFLSQGGDPYDETVARKLMHPGLKLLLVTEGSNGCRYYTKKFSGAVKGLQVEAIDTTGAGDSFVSGLLTQLAEDHGLLESEERLRHALHFANACGAITVTERGAIPALPTRETVLAFLRSA